MESFEEISFVVDPKNTLPPKMPPKKIKPTTRMNNFFFADFTLVLYSDNVDFRISPFVLVLLFYDHH